MFANAYAVIIDTFCQNQLSYIHKLKAAVKGLEGLLSLMDEKFKELRISLDNTQR